MKRRIADIYTHDEGERPEALVVYREDTWVGVSVEYERLTGDKCIMPDAGIVIPLDRFDAFMEALKLAKGST